jgi:hypothetical protein
MVHAARAAELSRANQQNMLGGMQMMELARANQQKNAMRDILSKAPEGAPPSEINRLIEKAYIGAGDISGLVAHRKTLAEAEAAQANVLKAKAQTKQAESTTAANEFDLNKKKMTHAWESVSKSANPAEFKANIYDALSKKYITQEEADTGLAKLEQAELQDRMTGGNANFMKLRMGSLEKLLPVLDAIKLKEAKPEKVEAGRTIEFRDLNPNSPTYGQLVGPKSITKTQTFAEEETARHNKKTEGIQGAELKLKQEKELREKDPAFQQAMAGAKARGEAIAKGDVAAVQALPKILDRANRSIALIDELVGKQEVRDKNGKLIQQGTAPHPGFNSAVGFGLGERFVPGTSASDFQSRFEEIKGGAFLEAFESLKGAGSISEKEGEKATTAITRMSLAQSEKEFVAAARDLQDVVRKATVNAQNRASQAGATPNVDALIDKYKTK